MKTLVLKDACTPMFIEADFTTANTWEQPVSVNNWMDKKDVIYIQEYYFAITRNEMMPFAATWMGLEIIILSEVSWTEKYKYIIYMWNLKKSDTNESIYEIETDSQIKKTNLQLPKGRVWGGLN